ncbi:MAG: hypothetical protein KBF37_01265 [Saprospiraceae bacterium]|jgi:chromosome segregation ATPase|nr:hypothetical protein [Saprospiraceae bacterium]MBP9208924.1 hypothetical protein [Saprospiraceae bacterium]
MKIRVYILIIGLLASCVSAKKYKALEANHAGLQTEYQLSQKGLTSSQNVIADLYNDRDSLSSIVYKQTLRVKELEHTVNDQEQKIGSSIVEVQTLTTEVSRLTKWVDDLSQTCKTNAEIMRRTMDDLNTQQLKVLNLSLALQRFDSMQISSVKRAKKQLSEEKIRRSLEKVGFVFY